MAGSRLEEEVYTFLRKRLSRQGKGLRTSFGEVVSNFISKNEGMCRHPEEGHLHVLLKGM